MAKRKEYSEEVQDLLKQLVDHFDREDVSVRQRQIRTWRRLKLLWEGFRNVYYSEVAHDWRIPNLPQQSDDTDQSYYDKPINVFRAYLETIIAALSVTVPAIKCFPDDADNPLDLLTAKAGDQISKLIDRHNDVELLWLHALFIFCTEGMVACYNFSKTNKEYGQYQEDTYQDEPEEHEIVTCPECNFELSDTIVNPEEGEGHNPLSPEMMGQGAPGMMGGLGQEGMGQGMQPPDMLGQEGLESCPNCGAMINPSIQRTTMTISRLIKKEMKDKTRQCFEARGGLYIKIPTYARSQADCPYLRYSYEAHYVYAIEKHPNLRDKLQGKPQGIQDPYEAWGRLSPQYLGEYPINNVTCNDWWFRPVAFDVLPEEDAKLLRKHFPEGVCAQFVNDFYGCAFPDKLDDSWTLTYNPMSDYLQHDPLGLLLVSVQEITNDLVSLTVQTIEHGIGQTFADPKVLNFDAYRQMETVPGGIYPTKSTNKPISEGFFEVKTATLSQEVLPFGQQIQGMGQLVSAALPSLFGGAMEEQKTASGYAMSRAQALQRLQNTWKTFKTWWKCIHAKVIPKFIENMHDDEREVGLDSNGNFINQFIRKADLEGKIGKFELEASENLPVTWSQRKDVVFQLLQTNNEEILATLAAPENLPILREALGLDDFYIPGEDDRIKQYEEIRYLLAGEPIFLPPIVDPMMASQNPEMAQDPAMMQAMQPQEVPSVDVDPDIDNHQLEFEICRGWLVSDAGRLAKTENPDGYRNVLLHAKAHLAFVQQAAMMQQAAMASSPEGKGAVPGKKPKETEKQAPIMSEADVKES